MMKCSRSTNVATTRIETKTQYAMATCQGKNSQTTIKSNAVNSSTPKYRNAILAPQLAQRPRKRSQLRSGTFCCHGMGAWQAGQNDRRGLFTEISRGRR